MKKSLLLMISLIAIASCGGGGGGGSTSASTPVGTASAPISGGTGGGGSGNPTNTMPSNSIPSLPTPSLVPRLIPTDSTQLQIQADTPDYRVTGESTSDGTTQPIGRAHYEINRNEIGFSLESSGDLSVPSSTIANVKSGGAAISLPLSGI